MKESVTKLFKISRKLVYIYAADYIYHCNSNDKKELFNPSEEVYMLEDDIIHFLPKNAKSARTYRHNEAVIKKIQEAIKLNDKIRIVSSNFRFKYTKENFRFKGRDNNYDNLFIPNTDPKYVPKVQSVYNNDMLLNFALYMKQQGNTPVIVTKNPYTILNALYLGICVNPNNDLSCCDFKENVILTNFNRMKNKTHLFFYTSYIVKNTNTFMEYLKNAAYVKVIFSCTLEDLIKSNNMEMFYTLVYLLSTDENFKFVITPSIGTYRYSFEKCVIFNHAVALATELNIKGYVMTYEKNINISDINSNIFTIKETAKGDFI